jgi:DNA-binding CsgD family transcriptional regulator
MKTLAMQENIHRLWDELADFDVGQSDQAAVHLMTRLCELVGARNATWGGAIRIGEGREADPLQGWRVGAMKLLRPIEPHPDEGPFREILKQWDRREIDPSFLLPMRQVGHFRTYAFRRDLPPDWFDSPFFQAHYGSVGTQDAAYVGFPLNRDAESHFGFYADRTFNDAEIALLAHAARGLKWFHRQLMLSHGVMIATSPLTPTERKVLHLLLTEASEKGIANQLGLATSTTHQHVIAIFRKFGVRSRAGLMSLWLNRGG